MLCKLQSAGLPICGNSLRARSRSQNDSASMKKLLFILIFLGAAAVMTWLVWFRPIKEVPEEQKPEADVPVHVGKITRATLHGYVTAFGPVEPEPRASAKVAPPVPGVVATVKC